MIFDLFSQVRIAYRKTQKIEHAAHDSFLRVPLLLSRFVLPSCVLSSVIIEHCLPINFGGFSLLLELSLELKICIGMQSSSVISFSLSSSVDSCSIEVSNDFLTLRELLTLDLLNCMFDYDCSAMICCSTM